MPGYHNVTSGKSHILDIKCKTGDSCLVNRAFYLHTKYIDVILENEKLHKKYDERLQMAEFVREVAKTAEKSEKIDKDDVWKNMRASADGGAAGDYETSWLKQDIESMKKKLQQSMNTIETRAKNLTKYIGSDVFQKHLVRFHTKPLDEETVQAFYEQLQATDKASGLKTYREIDLILALLTVELAHSKSGREFLEKITDDQWLKKAVAFADMWGYIGKIKASAETIGQIMHNFGPILTSRINILINEGKVATIDDILKDPDLKRHFDFLDKKFKIKISEWLRKKAEIYSEGARETARKMRYRSGLEKAVQNWLNKGHVDFDEAYRNKLQVDEHSAKLDGVWLGLTLDSVALAMSVAKLFSDLKKAKLSDWFGALNDLLGLSKTVFELAESRIIVINGHQTEMSQFFKGAARYAGLIAGIVTAVLSLMKAYEGFKSKDWDVVLLGIAGAGLGIVGGIAAFAGLSTLGGITVILGILLAIISALILDPPIIDFLEDVEWGEDRVIKVKDTIKEYYKKMFKLSVSFIVSQYDANYSFIRIESNILGNTVPVFVEVLAPGNKSLGKRTIYPGMKKVQGKGKIEKEAGGWDFPWPMHGKRLKISKPWDIWPEIRRDNDTEYTIRAGIDPSNNRKMAIPEMALNDDTSGVEFPEKQEPILITALPNGYVYSSPGIRLQLQSGTWKRYITNRNGSIRIFAYTKYGAGCTVKITTEKDKFLFDEPLTTVSVPVSSSAPDKNGLVKTPVDISLPVPGSGEEYRINLKTELLDTSGKIYEKDTTYLDITS
jgi:hypothetical protein